MTTSELAEILGISRISLSKYLNQKKGVSAETAARIEAAIKKYKFVPNVYARSLTGKQEKIIGFFSSFSFVFDSHSKISSHFSTEFTNYIIVEAQKLGYKVLITLCNQNDLLSEAQKLFSSKMIMGGILFGYATSSSEVRQLCEKNYPLVLVNQEESYTYPNVSMVNMDDENCAYEHVRRLIELGHRKLLYILSGIQRLPAIRRTRGINRALNDFQDKIESFSSFDGSFNEDISYEGTLSFFSGRDEKEQPTAVIAANDLSAIGCIEALHSLGYKIPDDISVSGFDDILISSYLTPSLSTFRVDFDLLAKLALEEMDSLIWKKAAGRKIEVEMEYVERESVASVK